jgi:hypothetical protein
MDYNHIVEFYRGWNNLEKGQADLQAYVIDFDLVPDLGVQQFHSREQVQSELEKLLSEFWQLSSQDIFLHDKLVASLNYLRALRGESIDFDHYVEMTMGFKPSLFSAEVMEGLRQDLIAQFEKRNYKYERSFKDEFMKNELIREPDEIKRNTITWKNHWLGRLDMFLGLEVEPDFRIEFDNVNAYWQNWISGSSKDGVVLRINLHPRNAYWKGDPEVLALHEICGHAVQVTNWLKQINRNEIPAALGIITVHSPEQFITEGLAQTLYEFISPRNEISDDAHLSISMYYYRVILYSNIHYMLNKGAISVPDATKYLSEALPFDNVDTIEAELNDRVKNPLNRTYQYVYGPSAMFFKMIANHLNVNQKRIFLHQVYSTFMTPKQICNFVNKEFGLNLRLEDMWISWD